MPVTRPPHTLITADPGGAAPHSGRTDSGGPARPSGTVACPLTGHRKLPSARPTLTGSKEHSRGGRRVQRPQVVLLSAGGGRAGPGRAGVRSRHQVLRGWRLMSRGSGGQQQLWCQDSGSKPVSWAPWCERSVLWSV